MNLKSILIASSIATAALVSTEASAVSVLGITWDATSPVDFTTTGTLWEQAPSNVIGSQVTGYGAFTQMNNELYTTYGGGSNILTFSFTVELVNYTPITATQGIFEYAGVTPVNVYSTSVATYDPTNLATQTLANATSGSLFLGTALTAANLTGLGLNFASPNAKSGTGNGWLEVLAGAAGGAAASNFDTNTQLDPNGVLADFTFSSSFNQAPNQFPAGFPYTGTVTVTGQSIPEPSTIALLGLGFLAFGLRLHKKA